MTELTRLSKLMSERKICSRRDADRYIEEGLVRVNGEIVTELGTKVAPDAKIELENKRRPLTVLLNKPVGFVSCQPEKGYRAAIELITPSNQFGSKKVEVPKFKMLSVAGRLDIDSKGLLVLTQDGVIAKQLIGENSHMEKEYLVRVEGVITEDKIATLTYGLSLDGKKLKRAKIKRLENQLLQFILIEGKKRQIRRMCELVGLHVVGLKRVRIGRVLLGDLPEGKWRVLEPHESF